MNCKIVRKRRRFDAKEVTLEQIAVLRKGTGHPKRQLLFRLLAESETPLFIQFIAKTKGYGLRTLTIPTNLHSLSVPLLTFAPAYRKHLFRLSRTRTITAESCGGDRFLCWVNQELHSNVR